MSSIDAATASGFLRPTEVIRLSLSIAALYIVYTIGSAIYVAYLGPLSKFPGPRSRALTKLPKLITEAKGTGAEVYPKLHEKYGPVVRIAPNELSYAAGAEASKDLYGFKKAGQPKPYKDPDFYRKPFNGVSSLIDSNDADHSRQRKIVSHAFSDKALKDLEPMLKKWTGTMRDKLAERSATGDAVDMLKYYNCTTFDIMGDLSFNEGLNMLEEGEYSSWVKAIFLGIKQAALLRSIKLTGSLASYIIDEYVMNSEFVRTKALEHWNYSKERLERRLKRTPERPDLWSKILEKSEGPGGLSHGEHESTASLFMIAGTETTATALSGLTYYLLQNPERMAKLTKEIREAHDSYEDMTLESIARLKYLHACVQEGLRIYPPVPSILPRVVPKEGSIICGEFVPGNTTVGIHQLSTYRMEQHFKNPYEFHPERWLGDEEYKDDHLDALEPFSVGPRNCIGKNLAWHEMRLLLATVLLHFDVELCEGMEDWKDQRIYLLWEKKPLMCKLTPAKKA